MMASLSTIENSVHRVQKNSEEAVTNFDGHVRQLNWITFWMHFSEMDNIFVVTQD